MIGASGAIAGMLGAYLMLYPRANIQCPVGFFIFFRVINVPAFLVLSVIGLQFLNLGQPDSGVGYIAHIGGFLAGMALIPFFKKPGVSLFAAANSKPFRVVKSADSKSHIPSMVRRKTLTRRKNPETGNKSAILGMIEPCRFDSICSPGFFSNLIVGSNVSLDPYAFIKLPFIAALGARLRSFCRPYYWCFVSMPC